MEGNQLLRRASGEQASGGMVRRREPAAAQPRQGVGARTQVRPVHAVLGRCAAVVAARELGEVPAEPPHAAEGAAGQGHVHGRVPVHRLRERRGDADGGVPAGGMRLHEEVHLARGQQPEEPPAGPGDSDGVGAEREDREVVHRDQEHGGAVPPGM